MSASSCQLKLGAVSGGLISRWNSGRSSARSIAVLRQGLTLALTGVVIGTAVNSKLDLMAELHGIARTDFSDDTLTVNVGVRAELNQTIALLGSLGHDVRAAPGESLSLVSYLGVQLLF